MRTMRARSRTPRRKQMFPGASVVSVARKRTCPSIAIGHPRRRRRTGRSLRRFNSVFAEIYGRPPTEIRRTRRSADAVKKTLYDLGARYLGEDQPSIKRVPSDRPSLAVVGRHDPASDTAQPPSTELPGPKNGLAINPSTSKLNLYGPSRAQLSGLFMAETVKHAGTESSQTLRWRKADSN